MRKYIETDLKEMKVDEVICDVCKRKIEKDSFGYIRDHIHIEKTWGYNSDKDGEHIEADICEECFDKIIK